MYFQQWIQEYLKMKLYDIRIWGKKSQRDFVSFQCFSDCIPFELDTDYTQGFNDFNSEQSKFLKHIISLVHADQEFETEFDYNNFWLKCVDDIRTVLVVDITSNFHTISVKDLKKDY